MIQRTLTIPLKRAVHEAGTVLLEGPLGAGKTTLLRTEFPRLLYVTLRDSRERASARRDPAAFAARLRAPSVVDDVHLAPELVLYLASLPPFRALILASSRKLSLPLPTLRLYRPTLAELSGRQPASLDMLGHFVPAADAGARSAKPFVAPAGLLDGDVHPLLQFRDVDRFHNFREAAARASGGVLDFQALASLANVSRTTAVRWLAVLEDCFLALRLPASDYAYGRRIVRSPKLHFLDSQHFESRVVSELYRNAAHSGQPADLRYWRDSNGLEVALVYQPSGAPPMGIQIAERPGASDFGQLHRWMKLAGTLSAAMISAQAADTWRGPILRYSIDRL